MNTLRLFEFQVQVVLEFIFCIHACNFCILNYKYQHISKIGFKVQGWEQMLGPYISKGMFAPGISSALNKNISNELRCSFRLDSLC
jgi:hypothetical protein